MVGDTEGVGRTAEGRSRRGVPRILPRREALHSAVVRKADVPRILPRREALHRAIVRKANVRRKLSRHSRTSLSFSFFSFGVTWRD